MEVETIDNTRLVRWVPDTIEADPQSLSPSALAILKEYRVLSRYITRKGTSDFRIRTGNLIRYIEIAPHTFERDADVFYFPFYNLPGIPYDDPDWTMAMISRHAETNEVQCFLWDGKLHGVHNVWHSINVDAIDLKLTTMLNSRVHRAILPISKVTGSLDYDATPCRVITKIACFEWQIPYVERETTAYQRLEQLGVCSLAPRFLGQLNELGRVMGFFLEELENIKPITIDDYEPCKEALQKLHDVGLLHGDVNRHNFIRTPEGIKIIDFEAYKDNATEAMTAEEMEGLRGQLLDESGRGKPDWYDYHEPL